MHILSLKLLHNDKKGKLKVDHLMWCLAIIIQWIKKFIAVQCESNNHLLTPTTSYVSEDFM